MTATNQTKPVNKRAKKKVNAVNKETKISDIDMKKEEEEEMAVSSTTIANPVTLSSKSGEGKGNALNDPAIVAAGKPRRQPLSKKSESANIDNASHSATLKEDTEKGDGNTVTITTRSQKSSASDKSPTAAPKAPRAMRKPRSSHQNSTMKSTPKAANEEDESVICAPKVASRKVRSDVPTAATPPRFLAAKAKRERATSISTKANDSMESEVSQQEDKSRSVRFDAGSVQGSIKQVSVANESDSKPVTKDALVQQAALSDAAALLAQSTLSGFPHPSLYPNFLASSNLAQQQLASAQVLAQLRASVEGLKALKSEFENSLTKRLRKDCSLFDSPFYSLFGGARCCL